MGYRFFPLPDPFPDRNFPLQAIEVQRGIKKFIKKQVKNLEKEERDRGRMKEGVEFTWRRRSGGVDDDL